MTIDLYCTPRHEGISLNETAAKAAQQATKAEERNTHVPMSLISLVQVTWKSLSIPSSERQQSFNFEQAIAHSMSICTDSNCLGAKVKMEKLRTDTHIADVSFDDLKIFPYLAQYNLDTESSAPTQFASTIITVAQTRELKLRAASLSAFDRLAGADQFGSEGCCEKIVFGALALLTAVLAPESAAEASVPWSLQAREWW
ncbi:hypothetical protein CROQUDRAFT_87377 [Cronartium quercuum f. sp. fusiforme G11]|uniref:Uncharacterized protein n=1 Tax=Cronartium quercuum f. sp. fusiforme G11 TaxID=708437 RepID=A0A9P6TGN6_9BASI|nr:hypothetical protein CROQUDRAFT_87377 [Cronartium quercuum f. sp. fusiforme G11]